MNSHYDQAISERVPARDARLLRRRLRLLAAAVLLTSATLMLAASAAQAHSPLSKPQLVSGPDPLPDVSDPNHCGSAAGTDFDRHGWESEATVAVNPTNPENIVAAWIQDVSDAIVVAASFDRGRTWTEVVPPTTSCTPGGSPVYGSVIDPWLSFGADGRLYLSSNPFNATGSAVAVNTSIDGGMTWSRPQVVDTASLTTDPLTGRTIGTAIDGDAVTADPDPSHPGTAYILWAKADWYFTQRDNYVSQTTDGGEHWSAPVLVPHDAQCLGADGQSKPCVAGLGRLLVLRDGTLVDVFNEIPTPGPCDPLGQDPSVPNCSDVIRGPTTLASTRSLAGTVWTPPVTVGVDANIPAPVLHGAALAPPTSDAPKGTIHVSWQRFVSTAPGGTPSPCKTGKPCLTITDYRSTNAGDSWTAGTAGDSIISRSERDGHVLASPAIAVADDGTVGVAFYDHRNDPALSLDRKITDLWFRDLHDGDQKWQESHLAGSFDHNAAPGPGGDLSAGRLGFLGDYQGIAAIPGAGFATAYVLSTPLTDPNFALGGCAPDDPWLSACVPTDIFSTIIDRAADLSLTMADAPDPVLAGSEVQYHITVSNGGLDSATGVTVADNLPPGTVFVPAASSQGCTGTTTVSCTIGSLASGGISTVGIVVKTTQAGTLTNSATVSGNEADPNVANNSATATTTVNPAADLKLTKTANPSTAHLGQPLTYTITITNQGASAAQTLTMTDTWNKNAGFASVTTDGKGSCVAKPDKRTLTCNLSTLPSTAGSNVWTITLVLKPTSKPSVVNTASVTSSTPDPNTSNNSVTLTTPVSP